MTEAEWLTSNDAAAMLSHAEDYTSHRKLGLFHLECCRQICAHFPTDWAVHDTLNDAYTALDGGTTEGLASVALLAGQYADECVNRLHRLIQQARGRSRLHVQEVSREAVAGYLLDAAVGFHGSWWTGPMFEDPLLSANAAAFEGARDSVSGENISILRCIVGNPFRPVAFDPTWRSETAVSLATGVYEEHAFDRLPILADALEEAGCDHPDVLAHCRGPGPHARGCWVIVGVLGKS